MVNGDVQREKQVLRVFSHPLSETQSWCSDDESDGFHRYAECCGNKPVALSWHWQ